MNSFLRLRLLIGLQDDPIADITKVHAKSAAGIVQSHKSLNLQGLRAMERPGSRGESAL
jgi:hypothetical protein